MEKTLETRFRDRKAHTISQLVGTSRFSPPARRRRKRPLSVLLLLLVVGGAWIGLCQPRGSVDKSPPPPLEASQPESRGIAWQNMSALLAARLDSLEGAHCLEIPQSDGSLLTLTTGLDTDLQQRVEERLSATRSLGAVAAILEPASGRILALAQFNRNHAHPQVLFWKSYPAASLIKMVTAAAAIERGRLEPYSVLTYTGGPHSLTARNIRPDTRRWAAQVTLENAFARSVNPVFAKIGIYELGPALLSEYGRRFFFNQTFPCEVPFETSVLSVPEKAFGIAEAASGYNQRTLITPLHAAWIAGLIAEGGAAPAPWLIESVEGDLRPGVPLLENLKVPLRVLSASAAQKMQQLMEATITQGTCRRSFARRTQYPPLREITFGGKTGNVNNEEDTVKYDWFAGYARDAGRDPRVAICVFVLHDQVLGQRANRVAFDLFRLYYAPRGVTALADEYAAADRADDPPPATTNKAARKHSHRATKKAKSTHGSRARNQRQ